MNRQRWDRVQALLERALDEPEEARRAFLETACGDDVDLRGEVISLLAAYKRSPETQRPPHAWFNLLASPEPPWLVQGERIARRYRIGPLLGRGGMGEVYEAWDEELSIPVALKTLHVPGSTDDAHRRLKLEGILARSVWHPNVCRLYDLGRHGDGEDTIWFLIMELLRGETLAKRLQNQGRIPRDQARLLVGQMAAGLGAAHQAGVVHCDFKPGNVMLVPRDGGEQAVVTDFGIARAVRQRKGEEDPKGGSGAMAGTPAYMAPEQVRGEEIGPAADIYALGIVLYEMLTGTVPFAGDSAIEMARRRLTEEPRSPRSHVPDLDDRWESVILRCLAREPRARFGCAEDVAEALRGRIPVEKPVSPDLADGVRRALPMERDPFVGRQLEIGELERSLSAGARLVTLVGAGGMGKTRLAVHYGWSSVSAWPGGVWFCDLTEARSLEGIASSVAGSLGVQLGRRDPIGQVGHAIAGRGRCLVILDNFEQVVPHGAGTVGRWLERAGEARFVVTSREKLNLGEQERVLEVEPLSLETGAELFAARARRLRPGLEFVGAEAESAREIVRLVDGIPLAIELAGARMRVMSAAQIVAQMQKRFSLLTGGGSARHETLGIAIDGSWELLKPWEQSAWAQCSVFEGGFTLEAAEGVIDLGAWPEAPWVVDALQSLVEKSLLRSWVPAPGSGEEEPEARFGMFVTLQDYARMKLREYGPQADVASAEATAEAGPVTSASRRVSADRAAEQRHGTWYARYGEPEVIEGVRRGGPRQRVRVERELDNLVAACRRAVLRGDATTTIAMYRASWAVLAVRGPFGLGVELGREALKRLSLDRTEEALLLVILGQTEWYSGMVEESHAHLEAALAIARGNSDRRLEARILGNLGGMQVSQGQMEEGSANLEAALETVQALGDRNRECNILNTLSVTRRGQGRMEEALTYAERALEVARLVGDRRSEGAILSNLGLVLQDRGRAEEARTHYEAALAIHRETRDRRFQGNVHSNLGGLNYDQGRLDEARLHLEAALAHHRETGARFSEGITLINLGFLYQAQELTDQAHAHFKAALDIEREVGNRRLEGSIIGALGTLHQERGETGLARAHYDSALAIHRAERDRRSEGVTLAHLASLLHLEGSADAAREALATGEALLREVDAHVELGQLLCIRAELEHGIGHASAARATLREAEDLALRMGSGPASELGRMLAKAHRMLGAPSRRSGARNHLSGE